MHATLRASGISFCISFKKLFTLWVVRDAEWALAAEQTEQKACAVWKY